MKFCSMFSQLLPLMPRAEFDRLARITGASKGEKGFTCWDQYVALLFCQLGHAHSLREISGGLASCAGKLNHLGVDKAPAKSTLAYANKVRTYELYERLFYEFFSRFSSERKGKHKFRFKNPLISLDATVIDLCLSMYDWADFRRTKGAVKLHMQLDHNGYLPCFALITEGKKHEITVAREMRFERGTIVVFDRGYNDYGWFDSLSDDGVFFVTRVKANAVYRVVKDHKVPQGKNVLEDQTIALGKTGMEGERTYRRVLVLIPETSETMEFLTNNHKLSSATIAAIYKDRWQIESFFKALKQGLKIKTFLGTSANAVKTQIWTALIAMLLIKHLQMKSKHSWSVSNLIALLRMNLFSHRDLWAWLNQPFCPPPEPVPNGQGVLEFT
jgi:hypothetical protein